MPPWIARELWGGLSPETIQKLIAKAGSEAQAEEKLNIIIYNESHGPEEKRVRDRRSVLSHYLRVSQADVWPNDSNYETLALRQAREARDRALAEKALAEERYVLSKIRLACDFSRVLKYHKWRGSKMKLNNV